MATHTTPTTHMTTAMAADTVAVHVAVMGTGLGTVMVMAVVACTLVASAHGAVIFAPMV